MRRRSCAPITADILLSPHTIPVRCRLALPFGGGHYTLDFLAPVTFVSMPRKSAGRIFPAFRMKKAHHFGCSHHVHLLRTHNASRVGERRAPLGVIRAVQIENLSVSVRRNLLHVSIKASAAFRDILDELEILTNAPPDQVNPRRIEMGEILLKHERLSRYQRREEVRHYRLRCPFVFHRIDHEYGDRPAIPGKRCDIACSHFDNGFPSGGSLPKLRQEAVSGPVSSYAETITDRIHPLVPQERVVSVDLRASIRQPLVRHHASSETRRQRPQPASEVHYLPAMLEGQCSVIETFPFLIAGHPRHAGNLRRERIWRFPSSEFTTRPGKE